MWLIWLRWRGHSCSRSPPSATFLKAPCEAKWLGGAGSSCLTAKAAGCVFRSAEFPQISHLPVFS
eukprot:scaffold2326_cov286-Pinguiococcus_pyrenoidosus.AAC.7